MVGVCDGCGTSGPLAEARMFVHAPGLTLRCPGCDAVLARLVHLPDRTLFEFRGLRRLEVGEPRARPAVALKLLGQSSIRPTTWVARLTWSVSPRQPSEAYFMSEGCGAYARRMSRAVLCLTAMALASLSVLDAGDARASAVIGNGVVQLGVSDFGNLNAEGVGVLYRPTGNDGTIAGCLCEGWGAGNADADPAEQFSGFANADRGTETADSVSFTSTLETATSVSTVGGGRLEVMHEYAPFAGNSSLMEGKVTLRNLGTSTMGDVRYTRLMDWDIAPTEFSEFVTIRRGTTQSLRFSGDNGFVSGDPFEARGEMYPGTTNADFTDSGPGDHGAVFDFGFGALAPGESTTFFIYYGAAGTTADADVAVSAAGAEVYSYGKPDAGGAPNNNLNTFIFAFRGVGGAAIIPPSLALSPTTGYEVAGTPHTVTATLRDSARNPVPGSSIVFSVAGANPSAASTAVTDDDGRVGYTYTGTAAGTDTITACLDADSDLACGPTEVTRTATVTYQDTAGPETTIDSGPAESSTIANAAPTFEFSSGEAHTTFKCNLDDGPDAACDSPLTTDTLIDGEHTLSVRATDENGNTDTSASTRTFTVDTTGPQTSFDSGPAEGSTTAETTPTLRFSSTEDGSTFECRLDDGAYTACDSPLTTEALDDGEHTLTVRATDALGNVAPAPVSRTFTVDTTAPETTIDSGPSERSTTSDDTPTFELSSSETGSTFECKLDDGAYLACDSPLTTEVVTDGEHTLSVLATDAVGNADTTPASWTFTIDATAPETTIDSGPAEGSTSTDDTPTFELSSSEPDSTFECQLDDGPYADCSSPATIDVNTDGEHTVSVRAIDAPGNTDASPATRTFTVDTAAPQTTIDSGPASGSAIADDTPTFAFTSSEAGSTFECKLDDDPYADCNSPLTTDTLADGEHTFSVRATDSVEIVEVTPASRTFTVDTAAPQTTFDSGPENGETISTNTPTFEFSSSEADSTFECTIDGDEPFACTSELIVNGLSDGEHTLTVRATDAAGNDDVTAASRSFAIDTTSPQTSITSGPADGATTATNTPTFELSSTEGGSTFECKLDNADYAGCDTPLVTGTLADGAHTLSVRATDAAGNTDTSAATRTFTVDTALPQTTIRSGPAAGSTTADRTPTFEFASSEPGSTFTCRVDDGEPFACTSGLTLDELAPGEHTFSVVAADASGNADETPASRAFSVAGPSVQPPAPTPVPVDVAAPVTVILTPLAPRRCSSKRNFRIRLRPTYKRLASAVVRVNGKRTKVSRHAHGRLRARVNLTGLKRGSYKVKIRARGENGRRYKETRSYKVC